MKSYDFEYDGLALSDKGFIICKFGSNGSETLSNGSVITFNTVTTQNGAKHELTGTEYGECLTTKFDVCKHPCLNTDKEISLDEIREMMRWLNRKEFHKLKLLNDEYINIYFEASFNVGKIELDGKVVGLELEVFTNRPYALHEPININLKNITTNGQHNFVSQSDEEGYIYPDMEIKVNQAGNLTIMNSLENRTMSIANCKIGEIINVRYPIITSSLASHKIENDFNWRFFRIATTYKDKTNKITISLPCDIKMTYSPVVKVGL